MSNIPFYILAGICAVLAALVYGLRHKLELLADIVDEVALQQAEDRKETQRELTKARSAADEGMELVKKTRKRVKMLEATVEAHQKSMISLAQSYAELKKQYEEFETLADESVRAQIESEKAWAEGVRAIAGFGADIPTLNTKEIGNE